MKKYLTVALLVLCAGLAKAQKLDSIKIDEPKAAEVFSPVEISADFPGGIERLFMFIEKNKKSVDTQGTVRITFVIEKDGSLTNFKITKSLSDNADAEAIRIMKLSPKWKPAMQNGNAVRQMFTIPISFAN
jgi:protein TonB